ncbi:MAG: Rrf2 family transcriptional regulator [Coriobacteriia bacterium]|nr:Rrf2 family transcriptional regulator [Coriobacteriia bacterium]
MEITRRTDYAIRLISALVHADGKPLSVRSVAEEYDVPYSFARSIQHDLVLSGIISSTRGANGGMTLNIDPKKVTMLDLIESVQGPISVAICARNKDWCPREKHCEFHHVWMGADHLLHDYLQSVTLQDLIDGVKSPHISEEFTRKDAFTPENIKARSCDFCNKQHDK